MRNRYLFLALALMAGAVCIRLGFWQLDRLAQRRAANSTLAARATQPAVPFTALPADTGVVRFRRARVAGVADYAHELIVANRTRNGSPGVNLYTPVRLPGRDTAVLVNRGWVYAADGSTPADGDWREGDTLVVEGYVGVFADGPAIPAAPDRPRSVSRATLATMRARLPYPVDGRYLVALVPESAPSNPVRVPLPRVTDEGSHLGYAVQWFSFAAIAVVGGVIAFRMPRRNAAS